MEFLQSSSSSFFLMEMIDQNRLIFSSLKKKGGKNLENWKKCLLGSRLTLRRLSARNVFG